LPKNKGAGPGESAGAEPDKIAAAKQPAEIALSGRAITIEQRKRAQARRLAANLRANLQRRKTQARCRKTAGGEN